LKIRSTKPLVGGGGDAAARTLTQPDEAKEQEQRGYAIRSRVDVR
jgi:hypothetical protein